MTVDHSRLRRWRTMFGRSAFTLVELLVIIGIIGILMSLLLPAVQAAREAARRVQCQSNVRQLGLAVEGHHSTYRCFPSAGWGYLWVGDPDRGTGPRQPGGWVYVVLPYIEQSSLYQSGAGVDPVTKKAAITGVTQQALPVMNCPSRRSSALYPHDSRPPHNANLVPDVAKSDYAINAGDFVCGIGVGPSSLQDGDRVNYPWPNVSKATGICYLRSRVTVAQVVDGTSNTYCIGEKYRTTELRDPGDDQSMYVGYDYDSCRFATPDSPPMRDSAASVPDGFGSMHPGGCTFVFVDGSTRFISYQIDGEVHRRLGNRMDRLPVDDSAFR